MRAVTESLSTQRAAVTVVNPGDAMVERLSTEHVVAAGHSASTDQIEPHPRWENSLRRYLPANTLRRRNEKSKPFTDEKSVREMDENGGTKSVC